MNLITKTAIIFSLILVCSFYSNRVVFSEEVTDHDASESNEISYEHDHDSTISDHDDEESDFLYDKEEHGEEDGEHEIHDEEQDQHSADEHEHDESEHMDGAVKLTDEQTKELNLKLEKAGPGNLYNELSLMGETRLNQDLVAHVIPRMPGFVKEIKVSLGDEVEKGQTLAILESVELAEAKADYLEKLRKYEIAEKDFQRKRYLHEEKIASKASRIEKEAEYMNAETALKAARSLLILSELSREEIEKLPEITDVIFGQYVLKAPVSGTVIEKHITTGEKLDGETEVFTVADLSELWVDLSVPDRDIYNVRKKINITIESSNGMLAVGKVSLIGPTVNINTRTAIARVILENKDRTWKPGLFITGHIRIAAENVPVVVPGLAVQNIEGEDVIFIKDGDIFEPAAVLTGRRDRKRVEIIAGLESGTTYVSEGAFELKAIMVTSGMDSHAGHGH